MNQCRKPRQRSDAQRDRIWNILTMARDLVLGDPMIGCSSRRLGMVNGPTERSVSPAAIGHFPCVLFCHYSR